MVKAFSSIQKINFHSIFSVGLQDFWYGQDWFLAHYRKAPVTHSFRFLDPRKLNLNLNGRLKIQWHIENIIRHVKLNKWPAMLQQENFETLDD